MECYKTAAQLYISEHRVLEQRSIAFFLIQSLLAGGFITLLIKLPSMESLLYPRMGIILVGIAFCALYIKSGKVVARGASIWREYMYDIEGTTNFEGSRLWTFYRQSCKNHGWHSQIKYLKELPSPTLWLYSPMVFITAWMCALISVFYREWTWIYLGAVFIGGLTTFVLSHKYLKIETKGPQVKEE